MSKKCVACNKGVYPMDPQMSLDGSLYHKSCAKCGECGCQITVANFTKVDGGLLCKTHYMQKFKASGGVYAGGDKYKQFSAGGSPVKADVPPPIPEPAPEPQTVVEEPIVEDPPVLPESVVEVPVEEVPAPEPESVAAEVAEEPAVEEHISESTTQVEALVISTEAADEVPPPASVSPTEGEYWHKYDE